MLQRSQVACDSLRIFLNLIQQVLQKRVKTKLIRVEILKLKKNKRNLMKLMITKKGISTTKEPQESKNNSNPKILRKLKTLISPMIFSLMAMEGKIMTVGFLCTFFDGLFHDYLVSYFHRQST